MPVQDPIARPRRAEVPPGEKDPFAGLITEPWNKFFTNQTQILSATSSRLTTVALSDEAASIGATSFPTGTLSAGLYRINYYAAIVQAATTSSSLTVTIGFTDQGISKSYSGAAITGNTVSTFQSGTVMLSSDGAAPITYSTTYASVGAQAMEYNLSFVVEAMSS